VKDEYCIIIGRFSLRQLRVALVARRFRLFGERRNQCDEPNRSGSLRNFISWKYSIVYIFYLLFSILFYILGDVIVASQIHQVALAEWKGAIGVIFFSDPQIVAQKGRNETYPNSIWMPDMGVQYGTVMLSNGDPLTLYYPSIGMI